MRIEDLNNNRCRLKLWQYVAKVYEFCIYQGDTRGLTINIIIVLREPRSY